MKQVILKYRIMNRDLFEEDLSEKDLEFGPIYWQHDRVYVPRNYQKGQNYPRLVIRTTMHSVDETPYYTLILRRHIEDSGLDIIEETPVIDYASTANIILQLGFKHAGEVSRRRQTIDLDSTTTLHLDTLDDETTYAKLEATLSDTDSVATVRDKLTSRLNLQNPLNSAYFEL